MINFEVRLQRTPCNDDDDDGRTRRTSCGAASSCANAACSGRDW